MVSGKYTTHRPAQRDGRPGFSRGLREPVHPDTHEGVPGASALGGVSVREPTAVLVWLGVNRSHGAVWSWMHRLADCQPDSSSTRVVCATCEYVVDETGIDGMKRRSS